MPNRDRALLIGGPSLKLELRPADGCFDVIQPRRNLRWQMLRGRQPDLRVRNRAGDLQSISLTQAGAHTVRRRSDGSLTVQWADFPGLDGLMVTSRLQLNGSQVSLEIDLLDAHPSWQFVDLYWPRPFVLPRRAEAMAILPDGQGLLLPATLRKRFDARLGYKVRCCFYGAIQARCGYVAIAETPHDWLVGLQVGSDGPLVFGRWLHSLKSFAYCRRLRFIFAENVSWTDLVARYRQYAIDVGYHRSLRDKIAENPNVARLIGGIRKTELINYTDYRNFNYTLLTFQQALQNFRRFLKATGIGHGEYHLDGWGRRGYDALHPDIIPPLPAAGGYPALARLATGVKRAGWLFCLHDNYNQMYPDCQSYNTEDLIFGEDGRPYRDGYRAGGTDSVMNPIAAHRYVRRNYLQGRDHPQARCGPIMKLVAPTSAYFDQFYYSPARQSEDYNPLHPTPRRQMDRAMIQIARLARSMPVVFSVEHMYDRFVPFTDHMWAMPFEARVPGSVKVPIWALAFHDAIVSPYVLPNLTSDAAQALHEFKQRFFDALLTGSIPTIRPCPQMPAAEFATAIAARPLIELHSMCGTARLDDHELLRADGSAARSRFGKIVVEVDRQAGTYRITGSKKLDGHYRLEPPVPAA